MKCLRTGLTICALVVFVQIYAIAALHDITSDSTTNQLEETVPLISITDNTSQGEITASPEEQTISADVNNGSSQTIPLMDLPSNSVTDSLRHSKKSPTLRNITAHITSPELGILRLIQDEAARENVSMGTSKNTSEVLKAILSTRWDLLLKRLLTKERLDVLFPRPSDLNLSCYENLLDFIDGLVGVADETGSFVTEKWALQMLDAFGKPSAGLLKGVFQWVGNYEECLDVHARRKTPAQISDHFRNKRVEFGGKYCRVLIPVGHIVKVSFPETNYIVAMHFPIVTRDDWMSGTALTRKRPNFLWDTEENINRFWLSQETFPVALNWGVCVPNSCSSQDVVSFLTKGTLSSLNLPVKKAVCIEESRFSDDGAAVTTVTILSIFVTIVTLSTILDIYYYRPWVSHDVRKDFARGEDRDKEYAGSSLEMQPNIRESGYKMDVSPSQSHDHCAVGVSSMEPDGPETASTKQTTHKNVACSIRNTLSAALDDIKQKGSMVLQPLEAKARPTQPRPDHEDTSNSQTAGVVRPQDVHTLEAGAGHTDQAEMSVKSRRKVVGEQLIQGMSLYRNLSCLLRKTRSQGTFDCIQGMRVISLAWIVVGHCYTYGGMLDEEDLVFENSAELVETSSRLSFHIVGSAHLAVDTFFVISGCLSMLVTLRLLRRHKPGIKFWATFLFHRFWRLTPMYMVVMLVGMTLYDHVVQGPLKSKNLAEFEQCRHKWWSHLLYINNFYKPHIKCMTWSWFMAVDMQLFLISPIFIYTVYRNLKAGICLILTLFIVGVASAFVSEYIHGGQFVLMDLNFLEYWSYVYTMPWSRASVFAVGLILGVILYKNIGRPIMSKRRALYVWAVVASVSIFLVLINHNQWKPDSQNWSRTQQSFYESLVRPAWATSIAWVIFACCNDLGGYANVILGWRPFQVLSRLTYSLYLLHPMVIMFVVYSRRTTIYLDPANLTLVYNYIGNLTLTFMMSAVFSLIFEMPMTALENILWRAN